MDKKNLEYYLNRGNVFGYNPKNDDYSIHWIVLSKRFPISRFFEMFTKEDNPDLYQEQLNIKERPYQIWVAELKKKAYENEANINNDDYILNNSYNFASLEDAESFLFSQGLNISDIKWSSEIEFL